jgi:hypothetical protein
VLKSLAHRSGDFGALHWHFAECSVHIAGCQLVIGQGTNHEHTMRAEVLGQPIRTLQTSGDLSYPAVNDIP